MQQIPKSVTVAEGNTAVFCCFVSPDNAQVKWYIDGIQIYESEKYKIEENGPERKLSIHHSNKLDEGPVTAATEHDETASDFYVEGVFD